MRKHVIKVAMLLLLYGPALFAEPPVSPNGGDSNLEKPVPEDVNDMEVLRDPTVISEKMQQGLKSLTSPTLKKALASPGSSATDGKIIDPTRMNQNFREALTRKSGTVANGPGPAAATGLPKITLLASVSGGLNNSSSAVLDINGKAQMVRAGDEITVIQNNQVMTIQVIEIQQKYVKVTVLPSKEKLILR